MATMFTEPVSIVIPMYNAEKYIAQVLDAIYQQDYAGEREVIVVNDGSRDRSLSLVQEYARQRAGVTVIDQPNQGAVAATNNGFRAARYGIICSIDSDVVLHGDWLGKVMAEFSDPQVGAVQGYYKTPAGVPFRYEISTSFMMGSAALRYLAVSFSTFSPSGYTSLKLRIFSSSICFSISGAARVLT